MSQGPNADTFSRILNEKTREVREQFSNLLINISREDKQSKWAYLQATIQAARQLASILSKSDQPGWLKALIEFSTIPQDQANYSQILMQMIALRDALYNQQWEDLDTSTQAYDFDKVYQQYKDSSKLPELLDKLVEILEQIISSGQIDSIRINNLLKKLISTLKKSSSSSYYSMMASWTFVVKVLKGLILEEISNIPILGSLAKSLDAAMQEIQQEIQTLGNDINTKLEQDLDVDFKTLNYNSKGIPALPPPGTNTDQLA